MEADKPQWMQEHEISDKENFDEIHASQREILKMLKPISEAYNAANKLGKWGMAVLVFISIILGIILSIKTAF